MRLDGVRAAGRRAEARTTAYPVYRKDLDNIVGVLHLADLVPLLARERPVDVAALAREALHGARNDARRRPARPRCGARNTPLAIVIDEYGGTAGLVTFAGLMERIVGIAGGRKRAAGRITVLADGSALVDGLALVTDINAQFGLHIDEAVYNTLGGYVLGRLGRRARFGDRIEVEGRIDARRSARRAARCARLHLEAARRAGPVACIG